MKGKQNSLLGRGKQKQYGGKTNEKHKQAVGQMINTNRGEQTKPTDRVGGQ